MRLQHQYIGSTALDMRELWDSLWSGTVDPVVGLIIITIGTMFLGCAGFAWVIESWANTRLVRVEGTIYCAECGAGNPPNSVYCSICGKKLNP